MIRPPIIKLEIQDQNTGQHIEVKDDHFSNDSYISLDESSKIVNSPQKVNCKNEKKNSEDVSLSFIEKKNESNLEPKPPVVVKIEPTSFFSSLSPEDASKNPFGIKNHNYSLPTKNNNNYRPANRKYSTQNTHLNGSNMTSSYSIHSLLNLRGSVCQRNLNECECDTCANLLKDFMGKPGQDQPINEFSDSSEPKAAYSYLKSYFVSMLQPSDNKLAMKLFGSKKGVLKEKLRQQEVGHWIIHPCSNFRFYWDLVMLIMLIANVIILPVAISFFNDNWSHTGLLIFNLVSDSLFLLDIVVNFRTGIFIIIFINLSIIVHFQYNLILI